MLAARDLLSSRSAFARGASLLILAVAVVAMIHLENDPDFWWHLRVGDFVLEHGDVPRVDFLSWWSGGEPWLAHSWAWDVVLRGAYAVAGLTGAALLGVALAALVAGLAWRLFSAVTPGAGPVLRSATVLVVAAIAVAAWSPRAQVWDVVFSLFAVGGWARYRATGSTRDLILMIPAAAAWSNLHGSGIGAYWALAFALLVAIAARWLPAGRPARPLLLSVAGSVLAMALNPYGLALFAYPFATVLSPTQHALIGEWQAPDLADAGFVPLDLALVGVPALLIAARRRPDTLLALGAAGTVVLTLGSARYILLAAPFAAALALEAADRILTRSLGPPAEVASPPVGRVGGVALAVLGVVVLAGRLAGLAPAAADRVVDAAFPRAAVGALVAGDCDGRIWNDYDWGGYLSWFWREPVGAYGAADALGETRLRAYAEQAAGRGFGEALVVDDIRLALVRTDSEPDRLLRERAGWERRWSDSQATLWADAGACR